MSTYEYHRRSAVRRSVTRRPSRREMQGSPPIHEERDNSDTYLMLDENGNEVDVPTWDLLNPRWHDVRERDAVLAKKAAREAAASLETPTEQAKPRIRRRASAFGHDNPLHSKIDSNRSD